VNHLIRDWVEVNSLASGGFLVHQMIVLIN